MNPEFNTVASAAIFKEFCTQIRRVVQHYVCQKSLDSSFLKPFYVT